MTPRAYRALAALLSYPGEDLVAALPEIRREAKARCLAPLLAELSGTALLELQERYVALFDRSRALSLELFEHVHGESRDRGQAMVDLAELYARRGVQVAGSELPDYLPAFLEFLSLAPEAEARALLEDVAHILRALGERLAARESAYAGVFAALLGVEGFAKAKPVEDRENLDREWTEPEVSFGGPQPVRLYRKGAIA